jgi:hypothetical protein
VSYILNRLLPVAPVASARTVEGYALILLQARGVRWAIVVVAGLTGSLTGLFPWLLHKA